MKKLKKAAKKKTGAAPERLKINMKFEEAIKKALHKKHPKEGWPKPEERRVSQRARCGARSEKASVPQVVGEGSFPQGKGSKLPPVRWPFNLV
jgi:hypothetical protein